MNSRLMIAQGLIENTHHILSGIPNALSVYINSRRRLPFVDGVEGTVKLRARYRGHTVAVTLTSNVRGVMEAELHNKSQSGCK